MPFFSIVIPVYNAFNKIEQCLNSIDQQSFKDYEVILVDGASNDGTIEKIQDYCRSHNSVNFISEKDDGIYDAMNKGIAISKGQYLYFIGSDDCLFSSDVLDRVSKSLQDQKFPELIYGNVLLGDTCIVHNGEYTLAKLYYLNICHQSIFYSKRLFNGKHDFRQEYPAFADWYFNFKCFSDSKIRVQYLGILIAKFALGGASSKVNDALLKNKKQLFLPLAKKARRKDYYLLRKNTIDVSTLKGKVEYLFYYFLNMFFK